LGVTTQKTKTSTASFTDAKNTGIYVTPAFGKAIKENLIAGFDLNYGYYKTQTFSTDVQKNNNYGVGLFLRRYATLGKGFYVFGQARAGTAYIHQKFTSLQQPSGSNTSKGYNIGLSFYPGISYAVSRKFQLETGFNNIAFVQYEHAKVTYGGSSTPSSVTNAFNLGTSLSSLTGFVLGFRFLLN
jgi:hypothetical protein